MEISCTLLLAKRDLQYVPLVGFVETPPGTSDFYKEVLLHLIRYLLGSVVHPGSHSMIGRSKIQTRFLQSLLGLLMSLIPGEISGEAKTC